MKKRKFDEWFGTFTDTVVDWGFYVDFEKVFTNMSDLKLKANLNILNTLIGSKSIRKDFIALYQEFPDILKVIPIILATRLELKGRGKQRKPVSLPIREYIGKDMKSYDFDFFAPNYSAEEYADLLEKTGGFKLLSTHIIANLQDYVYGVEVGLDSNARKNRVGKIMENLVETEIKKAGLTCEKDYFCQMSSKSVQEKFQVDLRRITNNGKNHKKFDFVIKIENDIYLIETNFYSKSGSKPNETARSYINLATNTQDIPGVHFVWITDGDGWKKSKSNLEEVFEYLPTVFNLSDIKKNNFKNLLTQNGEK